MMDPAALSEIATRIRDAANTFRDPVGAYVEGEAARRWDATEPKQESWERSNVDWDLASWMILAAATLSDRDLLAAYQRTAGEPGDPEADALVAEIERRGLDT